jgi:hypothetical protein
LSHTSYLLCSGYFGDDGFLITICLGCPGTSILLISVSHVAGIKDMSQGPPCSFFFFFFLPV